jgi:glycosyltransferase involved in cell wall biosynthesis
MITVSVIIPTFNRAKFLKEAVESVFAQSGDGFELIVVDDGSTDETAKMLEEFGDRVRVLRQENRGVSAARNAGIAAARGEWVAFLDSDDLWKKRKLEKQAAWVAAHPQVKICHTDEEWIRDGAKVNQLKKHAKPAGWIFEQCLPFCVVSPSSVMIHKSVFDDVGVFDETLPACEDYDLWLRIAVKYPFGFIPDRLVVKRGGHDDQLSKKHWGLDRFRAQALKKLIGSGRLKPMQKEAAQHMLEEKCRILAGGARKRGKEEEAKAYEGIARTV